MSKDKEEQEQILESLVGEARKSNKTKTDILNEPTVDEGDINKLIQITEDMKHEFLDIVLKAQPFYKTFEVIPGVLTATFKSMSIEETRDSANVFDKIEETMTTQEASLIIQKDMVSRCLVSVNGIGEKNKNLTEEFHTPSQAENFLNSLQGFVLDRYVRLSQIFQVYIKRLRQEVFSSDF